MTSMIPTNLVLDEDSYNSLKTAADLSFRSMRSEATLRVIDHIKRYRKRVSKVDITKKTVMKITIPSVLAKEINVYLLSECGFKNRTLVEECSFRLKDHLDKFESISIVGVAQRKG
ncbi:TraY domain-containing protein [Grimontia sp. SpTr1]|uniref:TraY domain-containing protein n=1 Tax=Grimontia sp. SpTr1 TaxID=2995319 RepID=UPI00248AE2EB|nr:TraY domain-containing protein [Grimontia sp. SpTr1]